MTPSSNSDRVTAGEICRPSGVQPLVDVRGVSVTYGMTEVVKNATFSVKAGNVVALIGPSGAGKSSLLRCLNLLETPSKGTIHIDGELVTQSEASSGRVRRRELMAHRRQVGMVFQQFNLFPHLTALENVMLAQQHALGRNRKEAAQRAHYELERVGLAEKANERPSNCSGGQQQRIAIARALAMDPKVMLFDEATSSLDPELGLEVLGSMRALAAAGMTMVVVTHEMHFAEDVADEVIFMAGGEILEIGSAKKILNSPNHPRTKKFVAAVKGR